MRAPAAPSVAAGVASGVTESAGLIAPGVAALAGVPSLRAVAVGVAPAAAQLSGGNDSSNLTNQSFQTQNQIRGIERQQTFENNQTRMQIQRNQSFEPGPMGPTGGIIAAPRR